MNKIFMIGGAVVGFIIFVLILHSILNSMGIDTCLYNCEYKNDVIGGTFVNGKRVD